MRVFVLGVGARPGRPVDLGMVRACCLFLERA